MVKIWYSLYDRMLSEEALRKAFWKVRSAKGAAGIDGQSINDFAETLDTSIGRLLAELREKSYQPQAVRRVEFPKPGGGIRLLGIPAVRDRVVQQALLEILQPLEFGRGEVRVRHQQSVMIERLTREQEERDRDHADTKRTQCLQRPFIRLCVRTDAGDQQRHSRPRDQHHRDRPDDDLLYQPSSCGSRVFRPGDVEALLALGAGNGLALLGDYLAADRCLVMA